MCGSFFSFGVWSFCGFFVCFFCFVVSLNMDSAKISKISVFKITYFLKSKAFTSTEFDHLWVPSYIKPSQNDAKLNSSISKKIVFETFLLHKNLFPKILEKLFLESSSPLIFLKQVSTSALDSLLTHKKHSMVVK